MGDCEKEIKASAKPQSTACIYLSYLKTSAPGIYRTKLSPDIDRSSTYTVLKESHTKFVRLNQMSVYNIMRADKLNSFSLYWITRCASFS